MWKFVWIIAVVVSFWFGWFLASNLGCADRRLLTVDESCISDYGIGTSKQSHRIPGEKEASDISDNAGSDSDPSKRQSGHAIYFSRRDILARDLIQTCTGGVAIAFALLCPFVIPAILGQRTIHQCPVMGAVILGLAMCAIANAGQIAILACGQPSTSKLLWSPNARDQRARGEKL